MCCFLWRKDKTCTASEYTSKPTTKQSVHYMYSTEHVHCTLYNVQHQNKGDGNYMEDQ